MDNELKEVISTGILIMKIAKNKLILGLLEKYSSPKPIVNQAMNAYLN